MEHNLCPCCLQPSSGSVCAHCGFPSVSPNDLHQLPVGAWIRSRYRIGKVLGQGGFGITYLAWDNLMNEPVAIKEFFPNGMVYRKNTDSLRLSCLTESSEDRYQYSKKRFLKEASALVKFKDVPEIVNIHDFVEENNTAYIVMEFVRGVDLAKYIQIRGGKLSVDETFRILRPVMETLAKVHKENIVHRDISPDNIILDPMGGAKLLDFGAIREVEDPDTDKKLTHSTEMIMKRGFAPLEQYYSRGSLGPWTDEYAMCATIWYCLTGSVPKEAPARLESPGPDWSSIPGLPAHQQAALKKGFSPGASDRYSSMDALLADLFPKKQPIREKKDDGGQTGGQTGSKTDGQTGSKTDSGGKDFVHRGKKTRYIPWLTGLAVLAVAVAALLGAFSKYRLYRMPGTGVQLAISFGLCLVVGLFCMKNSMDLFMIGYPLSLALNGTALLVLARMGVYPNASILHISLLAFYGLIILFFLLLVDGNSPPSQSRDPASTKIIMLLLVAFLCMSHSACVILRLVSRSGITLLFRIGTGISLLCPLLFVPAVFSAFGKKPGRGPFADFFNVLRWVNVLFWLGMTLSCLDALGGVGQWLLVLSGSILIMAVWGRFMGKP